MGYFCPDRVAESAACGVGGGRKEGRGGSVIVKIVYKNHLDLPPPNCLLLTSFGIISTPHQHSLLITFAPHPPESFTRSLPLYNTHS